MLRYPFSHLSVSAAGGDAEWRLLLCLFSVYNRLTVIYLPLYTPSAEEVPVACLAQSARSWTVARQAHAAAMRHAPLMWPSRRHARAPADRLRVLAGR